MQISDLILEKVYQVPVEDWKLEQSPDSTIITLSACYHQFLIKYGHQRGRERFIATGKHCIEISDLCLDGEDGYAPLPPGYDLLEHSLSLTVTQDTEIIFEDRQKLETATVFKGDDRPIVWYAEAMNGNAHQLYRGNAVFHSYVILLKKEFDFSQERRDREAKTEETAQKVMRERKRLQEKESLVHTIFNEGLKQFLSS